MKSRRVTIGKQILWRFSLDNMFSQMLKVKG